MFVWNRHADNNIFGDAQKLLTSTGSLLLFAAGSINFVLLILGEYKDGNDDDDDDGQINTENKIITIVSQRLICCRVFVSTLLTRLANPPISKCNILTQRLLLEVHLVNLYIFLNIFKDVQFVNFCFEKQKIMQKIKKQRLLGFSRQLNIFVMQSHRFEAIKCT